MTDWRWRSTANDSNRVQRITQTEYSELRG